MKIVMVTSWPPRWCGVASYSEELVSTLREKGFNVKIICHTDGGRPKEQGVYSIIDLTDPGWNLKLYQTVEKINPDIVHIQHEFSLYSFIPKAKTYNSDPQNTLGLFGPLFRWKIAGRPTVITYHTVYSEMTFEESEYFNHLMDLVTANVVHEEIQKQTLPQNLGRKIPNVFVNHHGTFELKEKPDKFQAKIKYGLAADLVVGMMGWWEPTKNYELMVKVWPEISKKFPQALLVIAGDARKGSPKGPSYKKFLLQKISHSPAFEKIKVIQGAFKLKEIQEILSTFDFSIYPYNNITQSGNLAHAYAIGLPVIVSGLEGLKSSVQDSKAGLIFKPGSEIALKNQVLKMLSSEILREKFSRNSQKYVKNKISWDKVVDRYRQIYHWSQKQAKKKIKLKRYIKFRQFK